MALTATRTLLALFVTFVAPGCGWAAEKPLRPHNGKQTSLDKGLRDSWEPSIHLDGRPVDRFVINSNKPTRSHRFTKMGKDIRSPLLEDVDPDWVNLDGFAVLGGTPVNNSSAGPVRFSQTAVRNQPSVKRATRVNRTVHPSGISNPRTHRRAPQSSSGPRQPERSVAGTPLLERRHRHHTKPQSDQRNRNMPKLTSESVHVVSLQAQRVLGKRAPANRAFATKITTPEPPEYEARDISVRVMSPQSVLITWVDPAFELGKVDPEEIRLYTVRYREKGESARWEFKDSTQRRLMIDSLSADSMYEFSVRISQEEDHGKWSVSVFQRTPESAPSGPPENFEVKPLRGKGTAVIATWDPPEESNGRIREYILSYAPAMKPFGMKSVTYRGSTTTATIEGLTPGDRYIFKIRATNRRGQGPQSKAFSVAMPGSSSTASSFSKPKVTHRTSHTPSKQETDHEEPEPLSTEAPEEPTTLLPVTSTQARPVASVNRRQRPLSQTRSYHSIFSSVRGLGRNSGSRGSSRGRGQDREDEEKEDEKLPTTPPPVKETTALKVAPETIEPDNDVSPEFVEEVRYNDELLTTETPSLKVLTPSPNKAISAKPKQLPRRPVKIRVHKKTASNSASSSSSSSTTLSTPFTSSPDSSSSFPSKSFSSPSTSPSPSLSSSSHIQESAANREDYVASSYPKDTISYNKPSTPVAKGNSSQQSWTAPVGRGSTSGGRISGSSLGSRYGFSRRRPGILLRGNSTRMLNGYKPVISSNLNIASKTLNQTTSKTHISASSQSTVPERTNSQTASDTYNFDRPQTSSQSRSHGVTVSDKQSSSTSTPTSQSSSQQLSTAATSGSHPSISHRGSHSSATSHSTHKSHTSSELDLTHSKGNYDFQIKNTGTEVTKVEEPTSSSKKEEVSIEKEGKEDVKTAVSRTRISPSLVERFPWLASHYPGRVTSGTRTSSSRQDGRTPWTRTSSSVGAGRPILRGTPTRVSGATGASGVSTTQETSEDLNTPSTPDSLKNGVRSSSFKPSLIDKNTAASSDTKNPITSSNSHHSTGEHRNSQNTETIHRGTSYDSNNNSNDKYVDGGSREASGRNDKVSDPIVSQQNPAIPPADLDKNIEDNESVDTRETNSGTRTGTPFGITPTHRRPGVGVNGRVRSPLLANRHIGGSRIPIRPQPAQNTRLGLSASESSSSSFDSSSSNSPQSVLTSDNEASTDTESKTDGKIGNSQSTSQSTSSASSPSRDSFRGQGSRSRYPITRGKPTNGGSSKPTIGNGKNGRPNLTAANDKDSSASHETSKAVAQRFITGPDGTKWVVDLERGILMNQDGKVLQDSHGKPKRIVLGEDGRTIFDHRGSPLLNEEGMALFGHGRDSRPVINPKEKVLTVGGKPVLGLDLPHRRTSTTTTTTTTTAPTTTPVPTTAAWTTEEPTTTMPYPTCPPGTFSKTNEYGYPVLDAEGILDCYPEEDSSELEMDFMVTVTMVPDALALKKDEFFTQTTQPPPTTTMETSTADPHTRPSNKGPSSEFDLSGRKRFTAPYVNYIRKDPGAPCSLTEALEYLQVDVLEDLMKKDVGALQNQPPKDKPQNITVVAMEGCHSFIILDWALPMKGDMVSGYMVHSASYDDVLNDRWSSRSSNMTHLAVENLKPNSRYYFKVQAKNVFGLGPVSDTFTYVTESDDPLLIERPPGGEPIWIPFSFKYNSAHSSCKGSQYVKRTWYRKFVGVVLCNSLRYKIFMGDGLREPFYSIGDTFGQGEDHCQFVDSYRDGRTGPAYLSNYLPSAQGYYRAYRQEPVTFGVIGRRTSHPFVGWYECGVPIPGKW